MWSAEKRAEGLEYMHPSRVHIPDVGKPEVTRPFPSTAIKCYLGDPSVGSAGVVG